MSIDSSIEFVIFFAIISLLGRLREFVRTLYWEGNIGHFVGREFIYRSDDLVFYHDYMGGIVRNKYFPASLITTEMEHQSGINDKALEFYPDRRLTNPPK